MKEGELSEQDLELLCKHIGFLQSLHSGQRAPETDAQRHFCAVCNGEEAPATPYEAAFLRWLVAQPSMLEMKRRLASLREARIKNVRVKRAAPRRVGRAPESILREVEQRYLAPQGGPDDQAKDPVRSEKERQARAAERLAKEPQSSKKNYTPRYIEETWGTRDAWRRDSWRNKYNGR
jgi:uncharacterized protein YifE (UPF0438 family)